MSTYSNFLVSFNWDFEFHLENAVPVSIKAEEKLFRFDYIKILNVGMSDCQKNNIFDMVLTWKTYLYVGRIRG